jgi:hypothetical protein
MTPLCKSIGCTQPTWHSDFCAHHLHLEKGEKLNNVKPGSSLSSKYPKYYKPVGDLTEVDVYAVHKLFNIQDPSGAIQHASKKLLLAGVRTGSKSMYKDIKEARDTLTRWLELNPEA